MNEKIKIILSALAYSLVWGFILALFLITGVQCWIDDKVLKGFSLIFGTFFILLGLVSVQLIPLLHPLNQKIMSNEITGDLYSHCPECGSMNTTHLGNPSEAPYKCNKCGNRFLPNIFKSSR
jgi:DNA-directed RNA polymerase subunit RPC12/RpoP